MKRMFAVLLLTSIMTGWAIAGTVKVLVLTGNTANAEFPVLSKFTQVDSEKVEYTKTNDRALTDLENYDIVWIGQGEICENAYFFDKETEDRIKSFVESGGIVITVGQDSDVGRPCEWGWLPVSLLGVERGGTESFEMTDAPEVNGLFNTPNEIAQAHFDDAWTQIPSDIIVLATINNGQDLGIGLLLYGKGAYIITSLENENASDVAINTPIMENLITYAVSYLPTLLTAVEWEEKLPVLWGEIKERLE